MVQQIRNGQWSLGEKVVEAGLAERAKVIPVGRHGRPDEIAATVSHLASDDAGFITGQAIPVDGGGLPASAF